MKIHHLRNATMLLELDEHRLLVDPMLGAAGVMPGFKVFGGGRRNNPLVELPGGADAVVARATAVLVTHEHPDHFDEAGRAWAEQRGLDVWASAMDVASLAKKGLRARELRDGELGMRVEIVRAQHGRGLAGWMMGPVNGFYLAHPSEPSVYLTSDAVLTDEVLDVLERLKPDVVVAPAGAANFGAGGDILFSVDELVTLVRRAPADVVLNHLEALDHCPTTRTELRERMAREGLGARVHIPNDGDVLTFTRTRAEPHAAPRAQASPKPGFQKWLTSKLG